MSLKIAYNNQIHKLSKYPADFAGLSKLVGMFFKEQLPTRWVVQYTDSDGDNITVADEHDYENLIEHVKENHGKTTKVIVVEMDLNNLTTQRIEAPIREESCEMILRDMEPEQREEKVPEPVEEKFEEKIEDLREEETQTEEEKLPKYIHHNVRCDGCGRYPVEGIRYKCSECQDFDFCEDCEATTEHPHHFIKMRHSNAPARRSCPFSYLKDLVPGVSYHQLSSNERSEFVNKATEALNSLKNIEVNVSQNQVEEREEEPQPEPEVREEEVEEEEEAQPEERQEEAQVEVNEEVQAEVKVEEAQPEPEVQPEAQEEVQEEAPKTNHKPKRSNSFSNFLNSVLKVFEPSKKDAKSVQEVKDEVEVKEEVNEEEAPVNEGVAVESEEVAAVQEEAAAEPEKVDIKSQYPREVVMLAEQLKEIFTEADDAKLLSLCNEFPYATIEQLADGYLRSL